MGRLSEMQPAGLARAAATFGLLACCVAVATLALLASSAGGSNNAFVVDTTADTADANPGDTVCADAGGDCSLRAAIEETNATAVGHAIHFDVGGCPPACTITIPFALPEIGGGGTTVDGTTQPGYVDEPIIVLDGSQTIPAQGVSGLFLQANDVLVKGLVVRDFSGIGVNANSTAFDGRRIEENWILNNGFYGVTVTGAGTTIKDNLIAGNGFEGNNDDGIGGLGGIGGNTVVTGNTIRDNAGHGVRLGSDSTEISANEISGNGYSGVYTDGQAVTISGNTVTDNGEYGINSFGDNDSITGNTVSGSGFHGISVQGPGVLVQGNTVTANGVSGPVPERKVTTGLLVELDDGIRIADNEATVVGNIVMNNPGRGISILGSGAAIGGISEGESNTIRSNGKAGISVGIADPLTTGRPASFEDYVDNTITGNKIWDNGGLGIDLGPEGVTQNDTMDADGGHNRLQNSPVLTGATTGSLHVTGTLDSRPEAQFRIEFFASDACDPSGNGEGQEYIGSTNVSTDLGGNASFDVVLAANVAEGKFITTTATHLGTKDTSEFSACVEATGEGGTPTATPTPTPPGGSATPTASGTPTSTPTPTPTASPTELVQGDVDCDGDTDSVDALKELQDIAGLPYGQGPGCPEIGGAVPASEAPSVFGDVDCDGDADAVDALKILQSIAAIPYAQSEPCTDIGDGF